MSLRIAPAILVLPAGIEVVGVHESPCRWDEYAGYQFSVTVRTDSSGRHFVAAGIVTDEELASLPPCGQRKFDREFGPRTPQQHLGCCTRVTITKRKTVMRAEISIYSPHNPEIARYSRWAGLPMRSERGRPLLRLVVDNT